MRFVSKLAVCALIAVAVLLIGLLAGRLGVEGPAPLDNPGPIVIIPAQSTPSQTPRPSPTPGPTADPDDDDDDDEPRRITPEPRDFDDDDDEPESDEPESGEGPDDDG